MQEIKINVVNKVATAEGNPFIVCGNSDYVIKFNFDEDWNGHNTKTARFAFEQDGEEKVTEVPFSGNECRVPILQEIKKVEVGVYVSNLLSTTRCKINCRASILDGDGVQYEEPDENIYDQLVAISNEATTAASNAINAANEAKEAAARFESTTRETFANAFKKAVYGSIITVDDVSPVEHIVNVKVDHPDPASVTLTRCGKNLIDLSKAVFNGCIVKDNGVQAQFTDRYYMELKFPYLKDFVQENDGKTLTFSVGNKVPDTRIVLVVMYTDGTYVAETGYTNAVSLTINNSNRTVSDVMVRPLAKPDIFTDTTTIINNLQLEIGETATAFENYKSVQTYTPNADGTVDGITSLSPNMTLFTDTAVAVINCEYNRDANKVLTGNTGDNDMVTAEGTIVSPNADFAEVAEWADGNPDNEDRTGYFVCANVPVDGIVMKKATSIDDVKGVSILAPAFAGNYTKDKLDNFGRLLPKYSYVAIIGFVPVIDNGTCTVGGRCMPDDNGCAVPSNNSMGYQVINRIDEKRVLIIIEPNGDMVQRINGEIEDIKSTIGDIETLLATI